MTAVGEGIHGRRDSGDGWSDAPATSSRAGRTVAETARRSSAGPREATSVMCVPYIHAHEVTIIEQSAAVLLSTGTPYVHDASTLDQINPYLPGMALFGVPAVVAGMVGDGLG